MTPRNIKSSLYCTIKVDKAVLGEGGKAEPNIEVYYSGQKLKRATDKNDKTGDYVVIYSNNTKAGKTGTAKIVGIGNYTGNRTIKFDITN